MKRRPKKELCADMLMDMLEEECKNNIAVDVEYIDSMLK